MKYLYLLLLIITVASCQPNPDRLTKERDEAKVLDMPQQHAIGKTTTNDYMIGESVQEFSHMYYAVFNMGSRGISVVNITKDSLEVQLLKRQLQANK